MFEKEAEEWVSNNFKLYLREPSIRTERRLKMNELESQLKSYESYINDIPLVIDPCRQCRNEERKTEEQVEKCSLCCWYYTSNFELK